MKLGIDFGSSAIDYVLMRGNKIVFSKSIFGNKVSIREVLNAVKKKGRISKIYVTGAGSKKIRESIDKIPIMHVNEIIAIGMGGCYVSNNRDALVVSIGSGTCMVSVKNRKSKHIGGTSIGAKTLTGLAEIILKTNNPDKIEEMARKGNLNKTDITLKSIYPGGIGLLPPSATASHFGNLKNPNKNDIAKGLINLVAQSIGTLAVFGANSYKHKKIILTGKITQSKTFRAIILKRINSILKADVIIPKNSGIATAIGAIIYYNKKA
ncbi:MAG: hypothetical protein KAK00_00950 [Nanoarchaeota archaeon]|nr:hypothetical protein [Nanoarchaeota archaeon]